MITLCIRLQALDEMRVDPTSGEPMRVAVKLMRIQSQFKRELEARDREFNRDLVMDVLQTWPKMEELQTKVQWICLLPLVFTTKQPMFVHYVVHCHILYHIPLVSHISYKPITTYTFHMHPTYPINTPYQHLH